MHDVVGDFADCALFRRFIGIEAQQNPCFLAVVAHKIVHKRAAGENERFFFGKFRLTFRRRCVGNAVIKGIYDLKAVLRSVRD